MTKVLIPVDQASFERLREQARAAAGKASAPKATSPAGETRKPSPGAPAPKVEKPSSQDPADLRPKAAAPANSSGREQPARASEKAKVEETSELEADLDLHDVFFGRRG